MDLSLRHTGVGGGGGEISDREQGGVRLPVWIAKVLSAFVTLTWCGGRGLQHRERTADARAKQNTKQKSEEVQILHPLKSTRVSPAGFNGSRIGPKEKQEQIKAPFNPELAPRKEFCAYQGTLCYKTFLDLKGSVHELAGTALEEPN